MVNVAPTSVDLTSQPASACPARRLGRELKSAVQCLQSSREPSISAATTLPRRTAPVRFSSEDLEINEAIVISPLP